MSSASASEIAAIYGVDTSKKIVDIPDFDRQGLAELFGELGYTVGVEVGTERGAYAEVLCRANPELQLTCVDPWTAYRGYREHVSQGKLDGFYEEARERLSPYGVKFVREFSPGAAKHFANGSLDFVYIDGNHGLPYVMDDLCAWAPKVRTGGIVAGHDYIRRKDPQLGLHVVESLHCYCEAFNIRPLFIVGAKDKHDGQRRDSPRSWFWVVE